MNVRHHLPESCGELIEKHAGNTRLHTGEFTSELVDRIAQNMDHQFVLSLLEKCISSVSNSNRYVRGQTATIIGNILFYNLWMKSYDEFRIYHEIISKKIGPVCSSQCNNATTHPDAKGWVTRQSSKSSWSTFISSLNQLIFDLIHASSYFFIIQFHFFIFFSHISHSSYLLQSAIYIF